MTLGTYILNGNESGMHEERKQYSEGTTEGASGAVSWIIVQQENERQLDTIRVRAIERNIWRQGRKVVRRMWSEGSVNFTIIRNYAECAEVCEMVRRIGNRVAEFRFEYFCPDYVSKIGVSVTEHNS